MNSMFYRAFEERYRGSRELIKSRLCVYLPFIEPLKKIHDQPQALDLGCGRGEWLELLQQHEFPAKGVDLDEGMLLACKERNLVVIQQEAIDYIKSLDSESISVITAFHFVEHVPFEKLCQLVEAAHRVLRPGGLLIIETPNSENLLVGTSSFYLDPTHQRPVPASLLSFLIEYAEFPRIKTLFLQEKHALSEMCEVGIRKIFEGVSPDYSVIGQKQADPAIYNLFNAPFNREYGVSLLAIADHYDQQIKAHIQWCQNEIKRVHEYASISWQTQQKIYDIIKYMGVFIKRAGRIAKRSVKSSMKLLQFIGKAVFTLLLKLMRKILNDTGLKHWILQVLNRHPYFKARAHQIAVRFHLIDHNKPLLRQTSVYIKLRKWLSLKLVRYPRLKTRLYQIAIKFHLIEHRQLPQYFAELDAAQGDYFFLNLSPRAADIYTILQRTREDYQEGKG